MERSRTVRRMVAALGAAALLAGLLAVPAAGGSPTTIWVDKDGRAGPRGCGGSAVAQTRIQDAVDAAAPLTTIRVCPGTYREIVSIGKRGIRLIGVSPWKATLRPPAGAGTFPAMLTIAANGVRVQWMRILVPSQGCRYSADGINLDGVRNATIRANRIVGGRSDLSAFCGLRDGVSGTGSDITVAFNLIRDWVIVGIRLRSGAPASVVPNADLRIRHNSLHWRHARLERCTGTCTSGDTAPQHAMELSHSKLDLARNRIILHPGLTLDQFDSGIRLVGTRGRVANNIVHRAATGLDLVAVRGRIVGNRIGRAGEIGILVREPAPAGMLRIIGNRARNQQTGIHVEAVPVVGIVRGNDFRGNRGTDCVDRSGDGTSIIWVDNLGDESDPVGICAPA